MGFLSKLKAKVLKQKNNDEVLDVVKTNIEKQKTEKYEKALSKSRESFTNKIQLLFAKHREVNEEYFQELEEILILSDVGVHQTTELINTLKNQAKIKKISTSSEMNELIFSFLFERYTQNQKNLFNLNLTKNELNVILIMGVNGVGKTTTIGKLTKKLLDDNWKVSLVAGDTFRFGAVEQLKIWAQRNNVSIATPEKQGQDPGSVVYQGIAKAKNNNTEVLIVDTAGRLNNKQNLMQELEKINKIIEKETGKKTKETLLVLDATTGQNGIIQASAFNDIVKLTGIILTKMDSSAKGGIILSIKDTFDIPVKYIGLGEGIDDLEQFDLNKYLYGLTSGLEINEQNN